MSRGRSEVLSTSGTKDSKMRRLRLTSHFNDKLYTDHKRPFMSLKEEKPWNRALNGAARDGPAYSGTRRKDSAERLPREARTTRWQFGLPRLRDRSPLSTR